MSWVTVGLNDLKEAETYTFEAHHAQMMKGLPYACCIKCGLLYLRNEITERCIRWGCESSLHPEYIRWRKTKK